MSSPNLDLAGLRTSTTALLAGLAAERWSDADVAAPSLLPDWSRGHVLTHLARNADGIALTLSGGLRGEILARYPDGPAGRIADIEAGAGRPATRQLADVRDSAERLDEAFAAVAAADGWAAPTEKQYPAAHWLLARWQEVEIHRADLGWAYTPEQWPARFVAALLPKLVDGLEARTAATLHVAVTAAGSVSAELPDTEWTVRPASAGTASAGGTVDVVGPDWVLLAWLVGRADQTGDLLGTPPQLGRWM